MISGAVEGSIVTAAVAAAAVAMYGTQSPRSQLFGRVVVAGGDVDEVALTFDDGPNPAVTPRLLEVLAKYEVRATFFLIGRFVREVPELAREIAAAGHLIGNHTYTHPWLPRHSHARIREEIAGCNAVLEDTLGAPVRLFRPPHGARTPYVLRVARELGLTTVEWNLITGDWRPVGAEAIYAKLESGMARNRRRGVGTNIVLHDGGQAGLGQPRMATVEAVAKLLADVRVVRFVTPEMWV